MLNEQCVLPMHPGEQHLLACPRVLGMMYLFSPALIVNIDEAFFIEMFVQLFKRFETGASQVGASAHPGCMVWAAMRQKRRKL